MTRAEMEQIRFVMKEIDAISRYLRSPKSELIGVFYKDYRTGKGVPKGKQEYGVDEEELQKQRDKLEQKIIELRARLDRAELFIGSIKDSEMRAILRAYYLNGESQDEIAQHMNYDQSTISKKIEKFWSKS